MGVESIITRKVTEWLEIPFADQLEDSILYEIRNHTIGMLKDISIGLADFVGDQKVLDNLITEDDELDEFSLRNAAGSYLGLSKNFLSTLDSERRYRASMKHWQQYLKWKTNRNEKRAKMEADFGYDGKHGSHLLRLLRMGEEILLTGKVNVRRDDAEELYAIRKGSLSFEELIEEADKIRKRLDDIYKNKQYVIPKEPNRKKIDELCIKLVMNSLNNNILK